MKHKVVIVDDDAGMSQALGRLLNAAGFQTVAFESAEALLEAKAAENAACLVLDVHLPGLTGFELHHRLVQTGVKPPVIFITAYENPTGQAQARDAGALGYFTKPFPGKSLLAAIARATALAAPHPKS